MTFLFLFFQLIFPLMHIYFLFTISKCLFVILFFIFLPKTFVRGQRVECGGSMLGHLTSNFRLFYFHIILPKICNGKAIMS